jgi:hypothetical protein
MLLLCNYSGDTDYIYKTPINIEDLGNDLPNNDIEKTNEEIAVDTASTVE